MSSLELWPIGNCQVSALIDTNGDYVWGCVPRVDGDPLFSSLLGGENAEHGFWAIDLEDRIELASAIHDYIELFNARRRHSALGMLSPTEYEERYFHTRDAA